MFLDYPSGNNRITMDKKNPVELAIPNSDTNNIITPDSSLCLSDSDESVSDLIRVEAQITAENIKYQKHQKDMEDVSRIPTGDLYCVPSCKDSRKIGNSTMTKCCLCMPWHHLTCLDEDEEEGEAFWTCPSCRSLPAKVNALSEFMNSKINNLYMKLDHMYHLNTKLVGVVQKSNLENKLLRQQLNAISKFDRTNNHVDNCSNVKHTESVPSVITTTNASSLENDTSDYSDIININMESHKPSKKVGDSVSVCGNERTCSDKSDIIIVCDSIPAYIDKSVVNDICGVNTQLEKSAVSVNEAVDYIQDRTSPESVTVIHTGTNNLRKDTTKTITRRFQRLEANIKDKKLKKVAFQA